MAYDNHLAQRIREQIGAKPDLTEKKMFGGLAFLLGGRMAIAASSEGIMVRVDPAECDRLIASGSAHAMEMRGSAMRGWVRVPPERLNNSQELHRWVNRGVAYARSLPPTAR